MISAQDRHAVREGVGHRCDEALAQVGVQIRLFQQAVLPGGGRHRPRDRELFEDVLDGPQGLDTTGREPASAPRQHTEPAFILTAVPGLSAP